MAVFRKRQRNAIGTAVEMPSLTTGKPVLVGKITLYYGAGQYVITWQRGGAEAWSERDKSPMVIIKKGS